MLLPKNKQGFTLIEILLVVIIMAILVAIAVPSYKQHVMTAQVGTMWHELEAAKAAVTSDFYKTATYANSTYAANSTDFTTTNNSSIASISVTSGVITATGASSAFPGKTISITWTPTIDATTKDLVWTCSYSAHTAAFMNSNYCQ